MFQFFKGEGTKLIYKNKKIYCGKCKYYTYESSYYPQPFRCNHPCVVKTMEISENSVSPGGSYCLEISADAWKINDKNDCPYYKET